MKLTVIITQSNPEQVFTALRLANFAKSKGDEVSMFLTAEGVEMEHLNDPRFDIKGQANTFIQQGGSIESCGTCLKLRSIEGGDICTNSTMQGLYNMITASDKVITF